MEPHGRDEHQENILEGFIRGDDVTKTYLNDSGEGDESLNRGDGSGEVQGEAWGGREADEGEADEGEGDKGEGDGSGGTLNLAKSGEVYTYVLL